MAETSAGEPEQPPHVPGEKRTYDRTFETVQENTHQARFEYTFIRQLDMIPNCVQHTNTVNFPEQFPEKVGYNRKATLWPNVSTVVLP